jgi:hypothetical protein
VEFAFELALCAHLEETTEWVLGRQLGAAVANPGARVMDVVGVVPSPELDARAAITSETIPPLAIESDVGVGEAVYWRDAFDCHPDHARDVMERAVEVGFFERERRGGRTYVRQSTRYPDDWYGRLVGIENKPDLGRPGDLERQLRVDTALSLFDEVWLATESYVTGAHLNRLPEQVGIWRFDPATGDREVVREATALPVDTPGVEPLDEHPLRTDVALVSAAEKATTRRRIAERVWGKGWRTYALPACAHADVTDDGRPYCTHFDRVVDPASDCGEVCPAFQAGEAPAVDRETLRDARTPWVAKPTGVARQQTGLDRWG